MTDAGLRATAQRWFAQARAAVVVEVVDVAGSVPRGNGTRMLVGADGVIGTIGGGHLEQCAIDEGQRMLRDGGAARRRHYPLGPALGQCCGGAVTLAFARLDDAALARWPALQPRFRLQLHGAGHVGRAIARLLATIDCEVDWVDERADQFAAALGDGLQLPPWIRPVCVDAVEAEVAQAAPGTFFLVLTHSHALDMQLAEAILQRGDFGWFGLIGSRTKRVRFERRLQERGIDEAGLARMTCPIGVPGIDGKEPEIIAMAVVAQMLQVAQALGPAVPDRRHRRGVAGVAAGSAAALG